MGKKETEEAIADSRVGRVKRVGSVGELLADLNADDTPAIHESRPRHTLDELLAEAETSGQYPLPPEQREWVDAPTVGRELLPEDLQTTEAIAAFLADAEASGDLDYIEHAREVAAQARAMHGLEG